MLLIVFLSALGAFETPKGAGSTVGPGGPRGEHSINEQELGPPLWRRIPPDEKVPPLEDLLDLLRIASLQADTEEMYRLEGLLILYSDQAFNSAIELIASMTLQYPEELAYYKSLSRVLKLLVNDSNVGLLVEAIARVDASPEAEPRSISNADGTTLDVAPIDTVVGGFLLGVVMDYARRRPGQQEMALLRLMFDNTTKASLQELLILNCGTIRVEGMEEWLRFMTEFGSTGEIRAAAMRSLASVNYPNAVPDLIARFDRLPGNGADEIVTWLGTADLLVGVVPDDILFDRTMQAIDSSWSGTSIIATGVFLMELTERDPQRWDQLLDRLASETDPHRLLTMLFAAQFSPNRFDPRLAPVVHEFMTGHPDEHVRHAALMTFSCFGDEDIALDAAELVMEENKRAAISAIGNVIRRSPDPSRGIGIALKLARDPDPETRLVIVRMFARLRSAGANRPFDEVLRRMADNDPSEEVRTLARQTLKDH